ncbi:hypothetical protein E2C01_076437 [Portunus trituberculatus]|uniref:Uncharacterized protein n=1 Tax=Portunus trituberculatus TaxID=210409 RepID=A0A5B7ID79_PORTR|nr:hypothetical protein [Portunus trituberculatus]
MRQICTLRLISVKPISPYYTPHHEVTAHHNTPHLATSYLTEPFHSRPVLHIILPHYHIISLCLHAVPHRASPHCVTTPHYHASSHLDCHIISC